MADPARHLGPLTRRSLIGAAVALTAAACGHAVRTASQPGAPRASSGATVPPGTDAPPASAAPATPGQARVVRTGPGRRPEVALTFHGAGDPALGTRLLEEAERAGAKVSVLAVGTWLEANPDMARRVLSGGHDLGNHTYTHPTLYRLGPAAISEEVDRCAAVLQRLTGTVGRLFRPSGGSRITPPMVKAAGERGYPFVLGFDVDPSDNLDPGAAVVTRRVLSAVRPGSIVSLHLGHPGTVAALPDILSGLQSRGLRAVTATALIAP